MTSKLQRLLAEKKDLEEELIEVLDADIHRYARVKRVYEDLGSDLSAEVYTANDLDTIQMTSELSMRYTATSVTLITDIVDNLKATRQSIKELRGSTRVDPPKPIGDTGAGGRPGEGLDWGVKEAPTHADVDWLIQGDTILSQKGLPDAGGAGEAYRISRAAGIAVPVFGVVGRVAPTASVGGGYGNYGSAELMYSGDAEASAVFVGLTDDANIRMGWGSHFNNAQDTGEVRVFNLGLRGAPDGHLMNAAHGGRIVQLDGCWYVHHDPTFDYNRIEWQWPHSVSMGSCETLIVRNHKWRGERPEDPGLFFLYYSILYAHGQTGSFLFENNDCRGGNRGAMQNRPDALPYGQPSTDPRPTARVMIRGNYYRFDGAGLNTAGTQVIGLWSGLSGVYVYDNDFHDFPAAGLMVSGQRPEQNYPTESGNQVPFLYLGDNQIIEGPHSRRQALNLSSIDDLYILEGNGIQGKVQFDAEWNYDRNGTMIGQIAIHAPQVPTWMHAAKHYNPASDINVPYTTTELLNMLDRPAPF